MVEDPELRDLLTAAIDGKGAFRRFKDALMGHATERERWFTFRSERLRVFMEAWLAAHGLSAIARPAWTPDEPSRPGQSVPPGDLAARRTRNAELLRRQLRELADTLGVRDLEKVAAFAEFVKARRAARAYAHRHEASGPSSEVEDEVPSVPGQPPPSRPAAPPRDDEPTPSSRQRPAAVK
jgi:hypothetical protein